MPRQHQTVYPIPPRDGQEGLLTKLFGLNNVSGGPQIDPVTGQVKPALYQPRTGFLSHGSQDRAAMLNAAIVQQLMAQQGAEKLQGNALKSTADIEKGKQQHDIDLKKLEDALKNNDVRRALAAHLKIDPSSLTNLAGQLSRNASQELDQSFIAEGQAQNAKNQGANYRGVGLDPNKIVSTPVPAGGIMAIPNVPGARYGTLSGATQGAPTMERYIAEEGMKVGDTQLPNKYGMAARPGAMIPGSFNPAVDPAIKASAMQLNPNAPDTSNAVSPLPPQDISNPFPALNNSIGYSPSVSGQISPIPAINQNPSGDTFTNLMQYLQKIYPQMGGQSY